MVSMPGRVQTGIQNPILRWSRMKLDWSFMCKQSQIRRNFFFLQNRLKSSSEGCLKSHSDWCISAWTASKTTILVWTGPDVFFHCSTRGVPSLELKLAVNWLSSVWGDNVASFKPSSRPCVGTSVAFCGSAVAHHTPRWAMPSFWHCCYCNFSERLIMRPGLNRTTCHMDTC